MNTRFGSARWWLAGLLLAAVTMNFLQLFTAAAYGQNQRSSDMVAYFEAESHNAFDNLLFREQCIAQHKGSFEPLLQSEKRLLGANGTTAKSSLGRSQDMGEADTAQDTLIVVFGGLNSVFLGEMAVLILGFALVALVVLPSKKTATTYADRIIGGVVGSSLLVLDQARYVYSSVHRYPPICKIFGTCADDADSWIENPKALFTWSSYCFHGDSGWFFDALGYAFLYAAVGMGVAFFWASARHLGIGGRRGGSNELARGDALATICRVYTWLPYFSYMGFAVWVACTQINGAATEVYAVQATLLTMFLLVLFGICVWCLARVYNAYESRTEGAKIGSNPAREFLDPYGSKAFVTFIKIVLPLLTMLALWNDVLGTFASFAL